MEKYLIKKTYYCLKPIEGTEKYYIRAQTEGFSFYWFLGFYENGNIRRAGGTISNVKMNELEEEYQNNLKQNQNLYGE